MRVASIHALCSLLFAFFDLLLIESVFTQPSTRRFSEYGFQLYKSDSDYRSAHSCALLEDDSEVNKWGTAEDYWHWEYRAFRRALTDVIYPKIAKARPFEAPVKSCEKTARRNADQRATELAKELEQQIFEDALISLIIVPKYNMVSLGQQLNVTSYNEL